ncbi:MAG: hypothetical protein NXI31_22745 [bacterium]|nr:hypothetical protein [bacterium]
MKTSLITLLATLAITSLASTQSFVMLVRTGPSDLVVNASLVDAIANEATVKDALRKSIGDRLQVWRGIEVVEPVSHGPGTYQLHFEVSADVKDQLPPEQLEHHIDLISAHVSKRLEHLLHAEPRHRAELRRKELSTRLHKLLAHQEEVSHVAELIDHEIRHLSVTAERLAEQFATLRLDIATEERAIEHLGAMRDESQKRRDRLQAEQADLAAQRTRIAQDLKGIQVRLANTRLTSGIEEKERELEDKIRSLDHQLTVLAEQRLALEGKTLDAQQMLSSVLEQLPAASLALQRSKARLARMQADQELFGKRRAAADDQRKKALATRIAAEGLRIDIAVCKELLTETSARLARLEPVRIEIVRPR